MRRPPFKIATRVLVATGNNEPTEVGVIECDARIRRSGSGIRLVIDARRWRRALAFQLLRMVWVTWTMKDVGGPSVGGDRVAGDR